ncbi:transcription factor DIVARICATA-like protein, partial [Trifolium pratense]
VIPWTPKEHMAFLEGLKAVGKGKWKPISKNYVITRTPTQVASHAQKTMNVKIQKLLVVLLHWDHLLQATLIRFVGLDCIGGRIHIANSFDQKNDLYALVV